MRRFVLLSSVLWGSCTLDTELPQPPPIGSLTGVVVLSDGVSPGAREVQLFTVQGERLVTTTADDGKFTFGELLPGVYTLAFRLRPFEQVLLPGVKVTSGQTTDVGELRPASLRGTPSEGTINGVVSGMGGGSVFGATVEVLLPPANDRVASVTVGATGLFSIRIPPATYTLRASHPNYVTTEQTGVVVMEAAVSDLSASPLVLTINPATINGSVLKERDGLAPVPAAGAIVTLDTGATTTTDSMGAFTIAGLPAGVRSVRFVLQNHIDPAPTRTLELRAGMGSTLPPVTLPLARGSVSGVVELTDRAPLDVAAVTLTGTTVDGGVPGLSGYGAVVSPDPAQPWRGTYTITNVPYGTYEVAASRQRYSRATTVVTIAEVPAQASTLQLTPQLGEFEIDDLDPESSLGFTRRTRVQLNFTRFPTSGIADYRVSDDPAFADAGFVPYTGPQVSYDLAPADAGVDGVKVIYAQYRQTGGATSPVFQNSIVLDRVPPSRPTVDLSFTGSIGQGASLRKFTTNNQVLPLQVTGTDDRAGLSGMRLAGANTVDAQGVLTAARVGYQSSTAFTRSSTGDGEQRVFVQLVDNAGNVSAIGDDGVFIDTQAPSGSITIGRGLRATVNGFTNQPQVEVTPVTGAEPNGGVVQVKLGNATGPELDGAPFSVVRPNIPWTLAFGPDGARSVFAVFRDSAGNTSMPVNTSITLDTTPPSPVSATLVQTSPTNQLTVQVAVASSATDLSPTQAITVADDPGFTTSSTVGPVAMPATGQVTFVLTPGDGLRTLYARFRDGAGNDSITPITFTLDREAPTGSITLVGALADGTPSPTLTATTNVTVEARVTGATRYRLGDASMTACSTVDADYTALPPSGLLPFTLTGSGGTRTVRACFKDAAGNTLGGGTVFQPSATIAFDNTAPTGCTLVVDGSKVDRTPAPPGRTAQLEVTADLRNCSDLDSVAFSTGALTCATATYERPGVVRLTLPPGDGMKTISACARDEAANHVTVTPVVITLDTTPPSNTSVVLENGDGFVSAADLTRPQNMGLRRILGEASFTDATEVQFTFSRGGGTPVTRALGVSPTSLFIEVNADGRYTIDWVFADDLGNKTARESAVIEVDTVPPAAPVLTVVDTGNRSARLFWDVVSGVSRYQLVQGGSPAVTVDLAFNAPGEGVILGLTNRNEYTFAVRAVDPAGNVSGNSNTMLATTGWRRVSVPLSTTYPIKPLDIAMRGNEVFVVFSERDAEWLSETGNLRMAYSTDLGQTWRFSTIDSVFGWDRRVAHLTLSATQVLVSSVGTDQDPSSPAGESIGEQRVFLSNDGISWANLTGAALTNTANFVDTSGASSIITGSIGRFLGVRNAGTTNVIQMWSAIIGPGTFFGLPALSTYYDAPDNVLMKDFRTCSGNFAMVSAWREAGRVRALWHRFYGDLDFTLGQEGTLEDVAVPGTVDAMDLACAAQSGATNAYAVYRTGSTLGFRRKLGPGGSWTGGMGTIMPTNADTRFDPKIVASGERVMVVYRTNTGEVRLGESSTEGNSMVFRRVEADPQQGHGVVIGNDGVSADLALAWTDAESSSLTVLVPALRAIPGRALPGLGTATLAWNAAGQSKFRIDRSNDVFSTTNFPESFFTTQPTFEVTVPVGTPVMQHQLSGVDAYNQGTNDGEIWQVAPFQESTLIGASVVAGGGSSNSAGIVAHDDAVMVLPPFNFKAAGSNDLTVYTSSNAGDTMTPLSPASGVTTARRALVGGGGRAFLFYRTASSGLRGRFFTSLTPGAYPSEVVLDATTDVDAVAAATDGSGNNAAIVTADVVDDQVTFAWHAADGGVAVFNQPRVTIPNAGTDTLRAVEILRASESKVVFAWRQSGPSTERIYYVEANRVQTSPTVLFSYGAPVLLHDGSTAGGGNQRVSTLTQLASGWNDAYSVQAHVTQQRAAGPTTVNNLMLSVTGTEHPNAAGNMAFLTLDQAPAVEDSFSVRGDARGLFSLYQVNELKPSPTETYLRMSVCYSECHLLQNWWRRTLVTAPIGSNAQMAPVLALSTTSGNPPYRVYGLYKLGGTLRFLRGGSLRRIR